MSNRIEKTTTIEIAGLPIIFYKMANADIFIDTQNVDSVFGIPLDYKIPFVTLYDALTKMKYWHIQLMLLWIIWARTG